MFLTDIYEIQVGLQHSGHPVGDLDGVWGPKTKAGLEAMVAHGSLTGSRWSVLEIEEGLRDLGWFDFDPDFTWDEDSCAAAQNLIDADGVPFASFEDPGRQTTAAPNVPFQSHNRRIVQAGRTVDTLFLHTSATPGNWYKGKSLVQIKEHFRQWHVARGFRREGYHRIYHPNGSWIQCRPDTMQGAHAKGHNRGSLGWCLIPVRTITRMGQPSDWYTDDQIDAVRADIADLGLETQLRYLRGHNEVANKLCPGFDVVDRFWTSLPVQ